MKKILIPTDFSATSEKALEVASQFAKKSNASLYLLHILELPLNLTDQRNPFDTQMPEALFFMNLARERFEELLRKPYLKGLDVHETVMFENPFQGISSFVDENEIELIIMGSHGATGFKEMFIGSYTEKVVRTSKVPVLVIKNEIEIFEVETFVYATDFSKELKTPFLKAIDFAKALEAKLHLLYVNTPSSFLTTEQTMQLKEAFVSDIDAETISFHIYNDSTVEKGILNFAQSVQADLIGMATHGRKGIAHFFNGSVSEDLVNHAQRPVVTFKR